MRLKGRSGLVQVYQLTGQKEKPGRARGLEGHGISSPIVGRSAEYRQLYTSFERLLGGQGGMALVYGEAGLGKTRLLAEVRQNIPADRILWLEGHLLAYGQSLSYWPFQEILRKYMGITEEDDERSAWSKLETKIVRLFPENSAEILPYLASLLNLEVLEKYQERVKYLDGEAMGKQIFLARRPALDRCIFRKFIATHPGPDPSGACAGCRPQPARTADRGRPDLPGG
jgi:hypothetical protein